MTEAYALRRYSQELERRRGKEPDGSGIHASSVAPGP
jgi:hypothetical protein